MKPQLQQVLHPPLSPLLSPAFCSWFEKTYHVDPANLIAYFDMTRGRGGDVQTWPDLENGNDLEQTAAGNQAAIATAAGKLCRDFDGSDFMRQAVIASETGLTPADSRCSFATGQSWLAWDALDFSAYASADGTYEVVVEDSAGKRAKGYLKAVGGGETFLARIDDDCADDDTGDWTLYRCTIAFNAGGYYEVTYVADNQSIFLDIDVTSDLKKLYRASASIRNGTAGAILRTLKTTDVIFGQATSGATWANIAFYGVHPDNTTLRYYAHSNMTGAGNVQWKDILLQEVTDCEATGVHVTTTPGGATEGWATTETGFDYNDITDIEIRKSAFSVTGDLTVLAVIKPDDGRPASDEVIIAKMDETNNFMGYGITLDTAGKLVVSASNDGAVNDNFITNAAVFANGAQATFILIGFVYDASESNVDIDVNGAEVASTEQNAVSTAIYDTAVPFEVGRSADGNYFNGYIAALIMFARTLTVAERANIARAFNLL